MNKPIEVFHEEGQDPLVDHLNFFKNNLLMLVKLNDILENNFKIISKVEIPQESDEMVNIIKSLEKKHVSLGGEGAWIFSLNNEFMENVLEDPIGVRIFQNNFSSYLREVTLVYMITIFQFLIESNLTYTFGNFPEMLKTKEQNMNFEDIISHNNLEKIYDEIRKRMIKNQMDDGIEGINKFLSERLKIVDMSKEKDWKDFTERFYRRNLIVHSMLFVNDTYREKTGYNGTNHRLKIDKEYLQNSIILFKKYADTIHDGFTKKINVMIKSRENKTE